MCGCFHRCVFCFLAVFSSARLWIFFFTQLSSIVSWACCAIYCGLLLSTPSARCWCSMLPCRACRHPNGITGGGQHVSCQKLVRIRHKGCPLGCGHLPPGTRGQASAVCVVSALIIWWGGQCRQWSGCLTLCHSSWYRECDEGSAGGKS